MLDSFSSGSVPLSKKKAIAMKQSLGGIDILIEQKI
jgi:hypothetical protein